MNENETKIVFKANWLLDKETGKPININCDKNITIVKKRYSTFKTSELINNKKPSLLKRIYKYLCQK